MSPEQLILRFRQFLFGMAGALCAGIPVELWLDEHTEQPLQLVPFLLCGMGLVVVLVALWRPSRTTLWTLRIVMGLLIVGGALGVYEHLAGNLAFAGEVNPAQAAAAPLQAALVGGNPALAPGALAVVALLALAATYQHPKLG